MEVADFSRIPRKHAAQSFKRTIESGQPRGHGTPNKQLTFVSKQQILRKPLEGGNQMAFQSILSVVLLILILQKTWKKAPRRQSPFHTLTTHNRAKAWRVWGEIMKKKNENSKVSGPLNFSSDSSKNLNE